MGEGRKLGSVLMAFTSVLLLINSAALRFVPYEKMKEEGYGDYLSLFDEEP